MRHCWSGPGGPESRRKQPEPGPLHGGTFEGGRDEELPGNPVFRSCSGGGLSPGPGARLENCTLLQANLTGAGLSRVNMVRIDAVGAVLKRADLRGADLSRANLRRADLTGADLRRARLVGTVFYAASLKNADLRGAGLRGAFLLAADLRGVQLAGAGLTGAVVERKWSGRWRMPGGGFPFRGRPRFAGNLTPAQLEEIRED